VRNLGTHEKRKTEKNEKLSSSKGQKIAVTGILTKRDFLFRNELCRFKETVLAVPL
jgi:hypothetical protein